MFEEGQALTNNGDRSREQRNRKVSSWATILKYHRLEIRRMLRYNWSRPESEPDLAPKPFAAAGTFELNCEQSEILVICRQTSRSRDV